MNILFLFGDQKAYFPGDEVAVSFRGRVTQLVGVRFFGGSSQDLQNLDFEKVIEKKTNPLNENDHIEHGSNIQNISHHCTTRILFWKGDAG